MFLSAQEYSSKQNGELDETQIKCLKNKENMCDEIYTSIELAMQRIANSTKFTRQ